MKNKKLLLLSSILTIGICGTLIAGATYALFSSQSKTNIAVTSGTVNVSATVVDLKAYSQGNEQAGLSFENGGTVSYDGESGTLTLNRVTPGDKVTLGVKVTNNSNIKIKYQVKVAFSGELAAGLVAHATLPGDADPTTLTSVSSVTSWKEFDDTNTFTIPMDIELPYSAGNEYQGKSAEIVISVEAVQSNAPEAASINGVEYETLDQAIAAIPTNSDTTTEILLPAGDYQLTEGATNDKNIKFVGDSNTSVRFVSEGGNQSILARNATLVFDGVTIKGQESGDFGGLIHVKKTVFSNCTFNGKLTLYGPAEFTNCKFYNSTDYAIWTWGCKTATFTSCDFYSGGKALLLYGGSGQTDTITTTLTVNNCNFYDDGTLDTEKAAIEIGNDYNATYELNINNIHVDGFAINPAGENTGTTTWANKNSMDNDHLIVTIDGTRVH